VIGYAESSAVLTWLLGEPGEAEVRKLLADAERVLASTLTRVECARALARGVISDRLAPTDELAALQLLDIVSASWVTLEMTGRVLDRACARFPHEPVRTRDALHLATALMFHEAHGRLTIVSLDDRIRENAASLGLSVAP
jgi:predicted nucleic acid-binding protein